MFDRFEKSFVASPGSRLEPPWQDPVLMRVRGYSELMAKYAGSSFEGGLYRLHSARSGPVGQNLAEAMFPEYARRARVFGFDWLGRQASIDLARDANGQPAVLLLEPGTGQALEVPVGFEDFHNKEIVDFRDAALASSFFERWSNVNRSALPLPPERCVGYRIPLFLGGSDTIDNLAVEDFEVYWDLSGQLRRGVLGMPEGTGVDGVEA